MMYFNVVNVIRSVVMGFSTLLLISCTTTASKDTSKELFDTLEKANAAYSEGNWLEAEIYYQMLIEKIPDDAYAWLRIGNARLQTGQVNAAIAAYRESINHNPNQSKPYYNLSTAYMIQAQRVLETAKSNMQAHDTGIALVNQRIDGLKKLTTSGLSENESASSNVYSNGGVFRYFMPSQE